jgi:hypothetical protein
MMTSALEPCDSDNFTIDHVEEEGDEWICAFKTVSWWF